MKKFLIASALMFAVFVSAFASWFVTSIVRDAMLAVFEKKRECFEYERLFNGIDSSAYTLGKMRLRYFDESGRKYDNVFYSPRRDSCVLSQKGDGKYKIEDLFSKEQLFYCKDERISGVFDSGIDSSMLGSECVRSYETKISELSLPTRIY